MNLLSVTFIILSIVMEVRTEALSDVLVSNEWLAGLTPDDGENPWTFYSDGRFETLKDGHGGVWTVQRSNEKEILELKWDTGSNGWANFEIKDENSSRVNLACTDSGWEYMRSWNLWSKKSNSDIIGRSLALDRSSPFLSDSSSYRLGWKCDYYRAGENDKLSKDKFLFTQYITAISFGSFDNRLGSN